ncbi:ABC transporter ATP-binding protein [uncultured Tessaracoccus sp.]|uniref:ABC transporter ATP-binding protein n=1 Tax=uncultured Tessaracoccus sp. TaxID=905023 RepID=UPI0025E1939F|nr:ABC transporter ATP-binding protein [uncultured Tessaracoccus sp.]
MTSLELVDATLRYGTRVVAEGLDCAIPDGTFTAIIGPNGCGKSTTLKALAGVLRPSTGRVLLDGQDLSTLRRRDVARRIASLPQHPVVPDGMVVRDLVAYGRHPHHTVLRRWLPEDDGIIASAMETTGVDDLAERPVGELSGGQRQRVWLAMVLAQCTDHVLLDEPTTFLDLAHQVELLELCQDLCRAGRTVVAVLHDLNQAARYASHLVLLHEGRLVRSGSPDEVVDEAAIRETFGVDGVVERDSQAGTPMLTVRDRRDRLAARASVAAVRGR